VHIDLRKQCKVFDGIGAVSAGATSRLLVDYDEKERSDILDLLFKPGIGAELQLLKVEIGGDTFTGCGTEPSPQRSPHETSTPARGYELWLASEARLRNPAITILGLSWGFPAWIGAGALNENQVSYTEQWVQQAKEIHGIKIDWVGVVNESPWTPEYVKRLREALDAGGHGDTGIGRLTISAGASRESMSNSKMTTLSDKLSGRSACTTLQDPAHILHWHNLGAVCGPARTFLQTTM